MAAAEIWNYTPRSTASSLDTIDRGLGTINTGVGEIPGIVKNLQDAKMKKRTDSALAGMMSSSTIEDYMAKRNALFENLDPNQLNLDRILSADQGLQKSLVENGTNLFNYGNKQEVYNQERDQRGADILDTQAGTALTRVDTVGQENANSVFFDNNDLERRNITSQILNRDSQTTAQTSANTFNDKTAYSDGAVTTAQLQTKLDGVNTALALVTSQDPNNAVEIQRLTEERARYEAQGAAIEAKGNVEGIRALTAATTSMDNGDIPLDAYMTTIEPTTPGGVADYSFDKPAFRQNLRERFPKLKNSDMEDLVNSQYKRSGMEAYDRIKSDNEAAAADWKKSQASFGLNPDGSAMQGAIDLKRAAKQGKSNAGNTSAGWGAVVTSPLMTTLIEDKKDTDTRKLADFAIQLQGTGGKWIDKSQEVDGEYKTYNITPNMLMAAVSDVISGQTNMPFADVDFKIDDVKQKVIAKFNEYQGYAKANLNDLDKDQRLKEQRLQIRNFRQQQLERQQSIPNQGPFAARNTG